MYDLERERQLQKEIERLKALKLFRTAANRERELKKLQKHLKEHNHEIDKDGH